MSWNLWLLKAIWSFIECRRFFFCILKVEYIFKSLIHVCPHFSALYMYQVVFLVLCYVYSPNYTTNSLFDLSLNKLSLWGSLFMTSIEHSVYSLQISRDCQELEPSIGEQLASLLYLEPDGELMVYSPMNHLFFFFFF